MRATVRQGSSGMRIEGRAASPLRPRTFSGRAIPCLIGGRRACWMFWRQRELRPRSRGRAGRRPATERIDLPPDAGGDYVSTGSLPPPENVRRLVDEAHARFAPVTQGQVSQIYPALVRAAADLFGICVAGTQGGVHSVGDAEHPFTFMGVSKPFVSALICDLIGAAGARERLGVNAAGYPFNSATGRERAGRPRQPHGERRGLSRFAGRELAPNEEVYASAGETNFRNRSLVWMLESQGRVSCDPLEALDLSPASAPST